MTKIYFIKCFIQNLCHFTCRFQNFATVISKFPVNPLARRCKIIGNLEFNDIPRYFSFDFREVNEMISFTCKQSCRLIFCSRVPRVFTSAWISRMPCNFARKFWTFEGWHCSLLNFESFKIPTDTGPTCIFWFVCINSDYGPKANLVYDSGLSC